MIATLAVMAAVLATGLMPLAAAKDEPSDAGKSTTTMAPTMVVFDSSGSMTTKDAGGQTRIDAAKDAARSFIDEAGDDAPLGLVTYGGNTDEAPENKAEGCRDITGVAKPEAGNSEKMIEHMEGLEPRGFTPIGSSLRKAAAELPKDGQRTIILVSDGVATFTPPPVCDVAKDLKDQGIDLVINTVGFNVEPAAQKELRCIADATGGTYADASDADTLAEELRRAAPRAYNAYESDLKEIEGGKSETSPAEVPREVEAFASDLPPTEGTRHSAESNIHFVTPLAEGERVVVSATTTQEPSINNFRRGESFRLGIDAGELSCKLDSESATDNAVNQYQTATLYSVQGGEDGCDSGDIAFTLAGSGDWKQDEENGVEVTITRFGEPDMEGQPEPVKDKSEAGPVRGSGEPSEVTPGKWFTDATELSPKKPVQAQIVPGEPHFYRAPVEHGQQLAGKVSLVEEAKDFKESKAGDSLILTAYNDARTEIQLEGKRATVQKDNSEDFSYPAPILFANRYGGSHKDGAMHSETQRVWKGGEQYLAVNYEQLLTCKEIDSTTQLPVLTYDLVVDTFGDPVPEPSFASVKSQSEEPAEGPAEEPSARAQENDESSFPFALVGLGAAALIFLVAALVLIIGKPSR